MIRYIVYKTTNLVNNKIYIGVHRVCENEEHCKYRGSNKFVKKAVEKYGINNIIRETIFEFDDIDDAFLKERELVNMEFINRKDTYNLKLGGIYNTLTDDIKRKIGLSNSISLLGNVISEKTRRLISEKNLGSKRTAEQKLNISKSLIGRNLSEETKKNISKNSRSGEPEVRLKISNSIKGSKLSNEQKIKIGDSLRGKKKSEETIERMKAAQQKRRAKYIK